MGERADPVFGLGNSYQVKQFNRAGVGLVFADVLVDADCFTNLCPDRVHRRESRQRVLEHHGNRAPANPRQGFVIQAEQFIALEVRRSGHACRVLQQAHDSQGNGGFARAGFANNSDDFARVNIKVHTADGGNSSGFAGEGDIEVANT